MKKIVIHLSIVLGLLFPAVASAQSQTVLAGWSMLGNDAGAAIDVGAIFGNATTPTGISASVTTVWSWGNALGRWNFYTPSMTPQDLSSYADSKGYGVLSSIAKGEGFWVNAKSQFLYDPRAITGGTGAPISCVIGQLGMVYAGSTGVFTNGQSLCVTASTNSLSFSNRTLSNPVQHTEIPAPFAAYKFSDTNGAVYEVIFRSDVLFGINVSMGITFQGQLMPISAPTEVTVKRIASDIVVSVTPATATAAKAVIAAVAATPFNFPAAVPFLGTTSATTFTFSPTTATSASAGIGNFRVDDRSGNSYSGEVQAGSCILMITTSTFSPPSPYSIGNIAVNNPCSFTIKVAGAAADGTQVNREVVMTLGTATSSITLPVTVSATGEVKLGNNVISFVPVVHASGS